MIKQLHLDHSGGLYIYRTHNEKLRGLCGNGFSSLMNYLDLIFTNCPNEYFKEGPRSSMLKMNLNNLDIRQVAGHEMSTLTRYALEINKERFTSNHQKVQVFMLENDNKTIAMEIPVWLLKNEFDSFKRFFNSEKPLTGHIDILRIEDNKVWIWDYKPRASEEEFASTQVFFYALMLSKRTNIPIEDIRCGYFDEKHAFLFKPDLKLINIRTILDFKEN